MPPKRKKIAPKNKDNKQFKKDEESNENSPGEESQAPNQPSGKSPLPPALPQKKVYVKNKWEDMGEFSNMDDILQLLPKSDWAFIYESRTKEGVKKVYRCAKSKRVGPQCSAKRQILISSFDMSFYLSTNGDVHTHDDSKPIRGLSIETQNIINDINDKYEAQDRQLTALLAKRALTRKGIAEGTLAQIRYHLKKLKKNNSKGPEYSVLGLETERENIPEDLDVPFVLKSEVFSDEISSSSSS